MKKILGVITPALVPVLLAISCGPEMFHRGIEDAGVDLGPSPQADAGDDGAGDAADGGGADTAPCVTSFSGDLLYTFDTAAAVFTGPAPDPAGTLPSGWFSYPEPSSSPALHQSTSGWSDTEGHTCPGALMMVDNFTVYGPNEKVLGLINFNANWMSPKAYTRMHAWVKIPIPSSGNLDHLDSLQLATNTNNFRAFLGNTVPVTPWADGDWHELALDLIPGATYVPNDIRQVGIQLIAKIVAGTGPAAPVPTTLFIDDVWLELPAP